MNRPSEFADLVKKRVLEGISGQPFGRKVREGHATRQELAIYAVQTYHRNLYSSRFASANHARCPIPEIRRDLIQVILSEEASMPGAPPSHADLMLLFAEAVGLNREEVIRAKPLPSTLVFIDTIGRLSEGHWLEGMAFRASELAAPKGCAMWLDALQRHYGFAPEALAWWKTHQEEDVEHGNIALKAYGQYVRDESEQAIDRMIAAWRTFDRGIVTAGEEAQRGGDVGFALPSRQL